MFARLAQTRRNIRACGLFTKREDMPVSRWGGILTKPLLDRGAIEDILAHEFREPHNPIVFLLITHRLIALCFRSKHCRFVPCNSCLSNRLKGGGKARAAGESSGALSVAFFGCLRLASE